MKIRKLPILFVMIFSIINIFSSGVQADDLKYSEVLTQDYLLEDNVYGVLVKGVGVC